MFVHEGPARTPRQNAMLAGYLALVAGFVNSGGFVLIGSFTSHVTGSVGRLSMDLARNDLGAAFSAGVLVLSFFAGAFGASLLVESRSTDARSTGYGIALLIEALLLAAFIFVAGLSHTTRLRELDAEAAILCVAMGMQNSLVTQLSGSVVRTTHLTGVVTDLGIETARWYRWWRSRVLASTVPAARPPMKRSLLLLTIAGSFTVGAVLGGYMTARASRWAMLAPACAILAASLYAFFTRPERP